MSRSRLSCSTCGGNLVPGADAAQLRCHFCGTDFLAERLGQVEAQSPAARVSRSEAVRILTDRLRECRVARFPIESSRLAHVPYWRVEGKLVAWQAYREREPRTGAFEPDVRRPPAPAERTVEETTSREVRVSYPACDVRAFGLLGVAHRLDDVSLETFSVESVGEDEEVCAVVHPASAVLRRARLGHAQGLLPPRARSVRQRTTLLRTRVQLIYYPIWKLEFGGHAATVDAVRGRVLAGTGERVASDPSSRWLTAAAASGFVAGVHPSLAIYSLATWTLIRIRAASSRASWSRWLSGELGEPRRAIVSLGDGP